MGYRILPSCLRVAALAMMAHACLALPAAGKTLVFCSEGNPEALNPQIVTTTTGMNAGRPMFNNLVEFAKGSTPIEPGLAESWTVSDDGTEYIFRLRTGVKFHSNGVFQPTRTMNADDVVFSLMRQWKEDHPFHNVSGYSFDFFRDLGMPDLLKTIEKIDDRTVRITLTRPEAPFLANLAMPFNVVLSAEYADRLLAHRQARAARYPADRHGSVRVPELPEGRHRPLPRLRRLLGRAPAHRYAGLLDHAQPGRAPHQAEGGRVPRHGVPQPGGCPARSQAIRP